MKCSEPGSRNQKEGRGAGGEEASSVATFYGAIGSGQPWANPPRREGEMWLGAQQHTVQQGIDIYKSNIHNYEKIWPFSFSENIPDHWSKD